MTVLLIVDKYIKTEQDREALIKTIRLFPLGFTAKLLKGKRTAEQNSLQRLWLQEAERQGDQTAEEYRGYCKLHFAVPIMRNESPEFKDAYDRVIRPLPYEQKLEMMMVPLDFPVTRLMNTKQKSKYLDDIYQHFRGLGFELTEPKKG